MFLGVWNMDPFLLDYFRFEVPLESCFGTFIFRLVFNSSDIVRYLLEVSESKYLNSYGQANICCCKGMLF